MLAPTPHCAPPTPAELCARFGPLVSSLCWRLTRDPERARDAAQEVWLALLDALPTYEGRAKLSTWVFQITWRTVKRHTENERRHTVQSLDAFFSGPPVEPPALGTDEEHALWVRAMCDKCLAGVLQCLEPDSRLAYLLRDVAELDFGAIAAVLEQSEPAVRQMISRARRKLRRFLDGHCALQNPKGPCRCRMREHVSRIDLPAGYARIRKSVRAVRLYAESERVLPKKDYWLGLLTPPSATA